MNLTEYCTGIADAIREKEGSTGLIPAPDHAARIKAIKAGAELETIPVVINGQISSPLSNIPALVYTTVDENGSVVVVEMSSVDYATVIHVLKNSVISILNAGIPMVGPSSADFGKQLTLTNKAAGDIDSWGNSSSHLITAAPPNGAALQLYPACYVRGTLITLADGSTKPVENITYADNLLVWDFDNGCYASAKPLWIKKMQTFVDYFRCIFEDGTNLVLINNKGNAHRVFCVDTGKFEYANNCVGKKVMTINGAVKLLSCKAISKALECYNVITDYHMNVYANDVLTSTGLNNLYPVMDMKFVKEERDLIPIDAFEDCPERYYYGMRIGEQVNYSIERLNEKIQLIKALAIENGDK